LTPRDGGRWHDGNHRAHLDGVEPPEDNTVELIAVSVDCGQAENTPLPMLTVVDKDGSQVAVVRMEWSHCDAQTGLLTGAARRFAS
jgi:hypothetical protein